MAISRRCWVVRQFLPLQAGVSLGVGSTVVAVLVAAIRAFEKALPPLMFTGLG